MSKTPAGLGGNASGFATAFSLAFEFVGAVLLFWLLGRWADNRFGTEPWAQVIGSVIGWVGGFLHLYYKSKGLAWEEVPGSRRPAPLPQSRAGTYPGATEGAGEAARAHGPGEERKRVGGTA